MVTRPPLTIARGLIHEEGTLEMSKVSVGGMPTIKTIEIVELKMGQVTFNIVGDTPMLMNRLSKKAREELLLPAPKKNSAEREITLKHDPIAEFRESVYLCRDPNGPTAIHVPDGTFAKTIAAAAIDMPGATKAEISRLASIADATINLYGRPFLHMRPVRNSGFNRTPDIRTRACFPRWACTFTVSYVSNLLREGHITNLLAAAGMIIGVGDWRPQKGGSNGRFRIVAHDDREFLDIKKEGRKIQKEALDYPAAFDAETDELLSWFTAEVERREKDVPSSEGRKSGKTIAVPKVKNGGQREIHAD